MESKDHAPVATKEETPASAAEWLEGPSGSVPATVPPPAPRAQVVHRIEDERTAGRTQPSERVIVRHSEEVDQLFAAMAMAQGAFGDVEKTLTALVDSRRTGTKYEYDYETLADVLSAVRKPLSDNGIALFQFPAPSRDSMTIRTMLGHKSGQWLINDLPSPASIVDPQSVGSAMSYLRRYALKSILGIAANEVEDDGKAASQVKPVAPPPPEPTGFQNWVTDLTACADEGTKKLRDVYSHSNPEFRTYLLKTAPKTIEALKQRAEAADKANKPAAPKGRA